jgi:hypothetical protein
LDFEVLVAQGFLYQNQHINSPLRKIHFRNTILVSMLLVLVDGDLLTGDSTYTTLPLTQTAQSNVACMKTEGREGRWHNIKPKDRSRLCP